MAEKNETPKQGCLGFSHTQPSRSAYTDKKYIYL